MYGQVTAWNSIRSDLRSVYPRCRVRARSPGDTVDKHEFIRDLCRRELHGDHDSNRQEYEQATDAVEIEGPGSVCP